MNSTIVILFCKKARMVTHGQDVGSIPASRGIAGEHKYFFTDNKPLPDDFYRLGAV
jgi:hypothetical protein